MEESDFHKRLKSTGRNDLCVCGSGKKYKKCHMNEDEQLEHEEFKKRAEAVNAENEASKLEEEDSSSSDSSAKKKVKVDNSFKQPTSKSNKIKGIKSTSIPRRPAN